MSSTFATPHFVSMGAASTTNNGRFVLDTPLFDKIAMAVLNDDAYESAEDPRPGVFAMIRATNTLVQSVREEQLQDIEIDPYLGEINITWRNRQRGKRVKVIFRSDAGSFSVYHEHSEQGRVINHALIPNAARGTLGLWVDWVYA